MKAFIRDGGWLILLFLSMNLLQYIDSFMLWVKYGTWYW